MQDAWKLLPRFQLTGGLRWDPFFAQHNKYDEVGDFTLAGYEAGTAEPGVRQCSRGNDVHRRQWLPWQVRYRQLHWHICSASRLCLGRYRQRDRNPARGVRMFYDTSVLWNTMHVVLNPPWGETLSFTPLSVANGGGLANPYAGVNGPNPFPFFNPPKSFVFPTNGTFIFENEANKPTNVQQWDLAFQRQLSPNLLFSATYMGSKTSHIWLGISQNYEQPYEPSVYGVGASSTACTLPWGTGSLYLCTLQ